MAIDAKVSFLNQLEGKLSTVITAADMNKTLTIVSDVFEHFDVIERNWQEDGVDDLLDCYVSALKVEGRSQKTIDRYVYVINRMMKFVGVPTRRVTVYHLRNYFAKEKERGVADGTLEGLREVFSAYFNWLQRESLIDRNPTVNISAIKCPKKKKEIYSEVDLEKLHQCCKNIRDRAIISFLNSTGCRISEMTGLNRDAVDLVNLECTVYGKGSKDRTVFLDPVTGMLIQQYFDQRTDNCEALFASKQKKRLQPGGVREMLNNTADKAGVHHVHPHKFRRTKATMLAKKGMPLQDIQAILGHEKMDTTMEYVQLDKEDIKNSYRKYS